MSKPRQRKCYKHKKIMNDCEYCDECTYIGEGDFACMKYQHPVLVKTDWEPTDYYDNCKKCRDYFPKDFGKEK